MNDVNRFNNHISNIEELITYFKDKNHESKKRLKKYKTLTTILESVDTVVIIGSTATSVTLSITSIGLMNLPNTAGIGCCISIANKELHKLMIEKYNKYRKEHEKDQQIFKSIDKLYRKPLKDILFDKNEYGSLCNIFTTKLDKTKKESFLQT